MAINDIEVTRVKETSPVFHQFLDATYQLLYQHPTRFEFNERFLRRLLYHLYSCQYGTFLYNSEKERVQARAKDKTRSVWDYFLARKEQFVNPGYDPVIDDNKRGSERLLFPRTNEVRWWSEVFGRSDSEMNSPRPSHSDVSLDKEIPSGRMTPVLTGVETAGRFFSSGTTGKPVSSAGAPGGMATLAAGLSGLGLSRGRGSVPETGSPSIGTSEMEVEMQ
jgi:hypothetical protein